MIDDTTFISAIYAGKSIWEFIPCDGKVNKKDSKVEHYVCEKEEKEEVGRSLFCILLMFFPSLKLVDPRDSIYIYRVFMEEVRFILYSIVPIGIESLLIKILLSAGANDRISSNSHAECC